MTEDPQLQRGEIYVLGLGPGDPLDLPGINLSLMRGREVYLRTCRHPLVPALEAAGVVVRSLDHFYEEAGSFEEVYGKMAGFLLDLAAKEKQPVLFAVPGNPLVGETVVFNLLSKAPGRGVLVRLWPAPSFLEAIYRLLRLDPTRGLLVLDSFQLGSSPLPVDTGLLIAQVYNRRVASEVKLSLMDYYPDDHQVTVLVAAGVPGSQRVLQVPLFELDRLEEIDHLTTVYVPPLSPPAGAEGQEEPSFGAAGGEPGEELAVVTGEEGEPCLLDPLMEVMKRLLGPEGCPWDREQTHASLKKYLIEETYEVIDAIDEQNMHKLCEELGDLLLQVVFHASLAEARGDFTINQVIEGITEKLIRRHPHVFGDTRVENAGEVIRNWEAIKQGEGGGEAARRSLLAGVPRCLPSLQRAQKVQGKAALVGFDWPDAEGAAGKLKEEWEEVRAAWAAGDGKALALELGDLLFAAVNVARLLKVDAEEALRSAVDRFSRRFRFMEEEAARRGTDLRSLTLEELDGLWDMAKQQEEQLPRV